MFRSKLRVSILVAGIMICSNKEGFGQQKRIDELNTEGTLIFIPDSLKTSEQKELELKLIRVYHTNIQFRGDTIAFLMDKAGFLSEGLPEEAYLEYMELLRIRNNVIRNAKSSEIRQRMLSTLATINAVHLKFFGYEYSGDVPLLEYKDIQYTGPGGTPCIVNLKNAIHIITAYPKDFTVFPPDIPVDNVNIAQK